MLGAVIGDVVGSSYEGLAYNNRATKDYDFQLFTPDSRYTDDSICTFAIAETLLSKEDPSSSDFQLSLLYWCRKYPNVGYGKFFKQWFLSEDPQPYNSFGNGSAMRVSPIGFAYKEKSDVGIQAMETALPSHGHDEGITGAQATAVSIWLARNGKSKDEIKTYIEDNFQYDLTTPLSEIRPTYKFDVTCRGSVPQAIRAFLESTDFESAIRLAVSLGGDADTQGAITGGIAQAFYKKIPQSMIVNTFDRLPMHMIDLIMRFSKQYNVAF